MGLSRSRAARRSSCASGWASGARTRSSSRPRRWARDPRRSPRRHSCRPPSDRSATWASDRGATRRPRNRRLPAAPNSRRLPGTSSIFSGSSCSGGPPAPLPGAGPGPGAGGGARAQVTAARRGRWAQGRRRGPLGVVDAPADTPATGAIRHVRNTTRDRLVTFHFFEPLERFKVMVRSPRARPVLFVPFRLPHVATPDVVQRFGYLFRRTLLDRGLLPDLERLLTGDEPSAAPSSAPRSRLLEHIEANLLYYSTAIISAGDPAARHVALSKLRDPAGRPLTDVVENTVIGRVGNAIALPLRSAGELPVQWRRGAPPRPSPA